MRYFSQFAAIAATFLSLTTAAPLAEPAAGTIIADKYIVMMKPGTAAADITSHLNWVTKKVSTGIERTFGGHYNFNGYAGTFPRAVVDLISADPNVSAEQGSGFN